jgi:hypothetical protein
MHLSIALVCAAIGCRGNDGQSVDSAFRTIQRAATVAQAGASVLHVLLNQFDYGGIYGGTAGSPAGIGTYDAQGLEIAYNWVHDVRDDEGSVATTVGIYLDNSEGGVFVHHNVIWKTSWACLGFSRGDKPQTPNELYSNTAATRRGSILWSFSNFAPTYLVHDNIFDHEQRDATGVGTGSLSHNIGPDMDLGSSTEEVCIDPPSGTSN